MGKLQSFNEGIVSGPACKDAMKELARRKILAGFEEDLVTKAKADESQRRLIGIQTTEAQLPYSVGNAHVLELRQQIQEKTDLIPGIQEDVRGLKIMMRNTRTLRRNKLEIIGLIFSWRVPVRIQLVLHLKTSLLLVLIICR